MCYILKNTCISCKKTSTSKIKYCINGETGTVCMKRFENTDDIMEALKAATMISKSNGSLRLDMTTLMVVQRVENAIPNCSCLRKEYQDANDNGKRARLE